MTKFISLLIYSIVLFSCTEKPTPVEPIKPLPLDKGKVEQQVKSMLEEYHRAIREGGLMAEFDYLDNSPEFFWVPPGYTAPLSYDSVHSILAGNAPAFKTINFEWDKLELHALSDSIVTYSGIVRGKITDTLNTEMQVNMIESGTIIRRPDGWKLLSGQSAEIGSVENEAPE